jgi:vacuolar-type H+-ATPase subunit H
LKEENEKDISESSQKADELLEEIGTAKTEPQKKTKKLFGLF